MNTSSRFLYMSLILLVVATLLNGCARGARGAGPGGSEARRIAGVAGAGVLPAVEAL
jgi:hypothetical protein